MKIECVPYCESELLAIDPLPLKCLGIPTYKKNWRRHCYRVFRVGIQHAMRFRVLAYDTPQIYGDAKNLPALCLTYRYIFE